MKSRAQMVGLCALAGVALATIVLVVLHVFIDSPFIMAAIGIPQAGLPWLVASAGLCAGTVSLLFSPEAFGPGDGFFGGILSYLLFVPAHVALAMMYSDLAFATDSWLNRGAWVAIVDLSFGVLVIGWTAPLIGLCLGRAFKTHLRMPPNNTIKADT
jgi:hypothetical protein